MPAQLISHYRILGPLGSGGMGVVYRAEDTTLHRTVALKFLSQSASHSPKTVRNLRHEARSASALNHPNICTIFEVGEDAGESFIAMEYVEGRTLADLIRDGPLPTESVLRFGRQLTSALAHAHEKGVIHGDLKPSNVIVTPLGEAKILDFGLARRSDPTEFDRQTLETLSTESKAGLGGTLPYMAPEQIEGSDASPQTDIWAVGAVLYEALTGERPFHGESLFLLCNSILRDPPRPFSSQTAPGLATIISRCLEKEPGRRYQRAGEARAALEALTPSFGKNVPAFTQGWWTRSHGVLPLLMLTILVVFGVVAVRRLRPGAFNSAGSFPSHVLLGVLAPVSSVDSSNSAFDTGLADTLNARLGELSVRHPLVVIPMNASFQQRVTTVDEARQQFGVNLVLVLSSQHSGENIRVNYSLVDPRSHQQVRGGTITAAVADPFELQDRVFESVAAALELQLAPYEKQALTAHGTTDPAAYDFYVQGRGYLQDFVVPEKVEHAISLFERALEKDPAYADATAGLGQAYWRKYQLTHSSEWADAAVKSCSRAADLGPFLASPHSCLGGVLRSKGEYEKAAEHYRRALELDPTSDDAYGGLASAYEHLGRLGDAEQLYKQAIQVRPNYWATYNWLGLFYMAHGRYEDAVAMYSRVIALAPDSFTGYYNLGASRVLQGEYGEAIPLLEQSLSIRPTAEAYSNLGTAYFQMRQFAKSSETFEKAVKLDPQNYALWGNLGDAYYWAPGRRSDAASAYKEAIALGEVQMHQNPHDAELLSYLGEYHAMRGERKLALDSLERSLRIEPTRPDLSLNAGIVYEQLGETNRALDALERAISLGIPPKTLRDTPNFDALNDNERFVNLIRGNRPK